METNYPGGANYYEMSMFEPMLVNSSPLDRMAPISQTIQFCEWKVCILIQILWPILITSSYSGIHQTLRNVSFRNLIYVLLRSSDHCTVVWNIMIYCTALKRHSTVYVWYFKRLPWYQYKFGCEKVSSETTASVIWNHLDIGIVRAFIRGTPLSISIEIYFQICQIWFANTVKCLDVRSIVVYTIIPIPIP